nr:DUF378 domain-containing protein [Lysinibacillus timonensis]
MGTIYRIALVLVIIGALNWGLVGFFQYDLVADLFGGQDAVLSRWVYGLVGIAGLLSIPILAKRLDDKMDLMESDVNRNPRFQTQMEAGEEYDFTDERNRNKSRENSDDTIV